MASEFRSRAFSNSEAAHRGLGSEKRLRSPARIATGETATQLPLPSAAALAQLGAVAPPAPSLPLLLRSSLVHLLAAAVVLLLPHEDSCLRRTEPQHPWLWHPSLWIAL